MSALALIALTVRVVGPMAQVFPTSVPPGEPEARVEAARGEFEPFQIVVHAAGEPLGAVTATATPLDGPSAIAAPALYRVEYLPVKKPSSIEGRAGPWPDALVPDGFPFDVPASESRAIWVELFVPPSAAPGAYRGAVRVRAGDATATVPIELTVHRFALPRTSSLPVTFGFDAGAIARAHPGLSPPALQALVRRYEIEALRHRVSLHSAFEPAPYHFSDGKLVVDFAPWDAEVAPFLDGTADRGGPADGARYSAIDVRVPYKLTGAARAEYLRQMVAHLRARGWLDRAFEYTYDEPRDEQFADVRARAAPSRGLVPRLVTHAQDARLDGAVDIWCPIVNFVDDKPGNSKSPPRAAYDGKRVWWYQACMSHGCNIVGGDYFTGWPSYAVDAPAMSHRIFEWLTFRYRIGGELYYNTVEAYARGLDPWRDQYLFGGNGDGTLFYPGKTGPVASVRLALVREGLEDYEYLKLYARAVGESEAAALAASIAGKTYRWEHDPARLMAARHKMAEAIDRWVASQGGMGVNAR